MPFLNESDRLNAEACRRVDDAPRPPRRRLSLYAEMIREDLAKAGYIGKYDPRHIEAYMRLEHSTLDGLSARQFAAEVEIARQCLDHADEEESEALALSYGL